MGLASLVTLFGGCNSTNSFDSRDRFEKIAHLRVKQGIERFRQRGYGRKTHSISDFLNSSKLAGENGKINGYNSNDDYGLVTVQTNSKNSNPDDNLSVNASGNQEVIKELPSDVSLISMTPNRQVSLTLYGPRSAERKSSSQSLDERIDLSFSSTDYFPSYADAAYSDDVLDFSSNGDWMVDYLTPPKISGFFSQIFERFYLYLGDRMFDELLKSGTEFNIIQEYYRILNNMQRYSLSLKDLSPHDRELLEYESDRFMKALIKLVQGAGKDSFKEYLEQNNLEAISQITAVEFKEADWFEYIKLKKIGVKLRTKSKSGSLELVPEFYVSFEFGDLIRFRTNSRPTRHTFENELRINLGRSLSLNFNCETDYSEGFLLTGANANINYAFDRWKRLTFAYSYSDEHHVKSRSQFSISLNIIF